MAKENDIKNELLKQLDRDSAGSTDANKNSTQKFLDNYSAQLKRLKWSAIISWLIVILYALGMHCLKDYLLREQDVSILTKNEFMLFDYTDMGLKVLIVIAVLLSVLMYYKSKTLTLLQISSRLAGIEEQLKKLSRKG